MRSKPRSPFHRPTAVNFAVRAADTLEETEVLVYDEIGFWGIMAQDFVEAFNAIDAKTIHVRVNSPGGDVFDGLAIANAIRAHAAHVVTHIDGLAASIASVIALAGDEVRMAGNAFLMIHDPFTWGIGNAGEFRKIADTLDKIGSSLRNEYQKKTGASANQVSAWMQAETWFDATDAEAEGFVDAVDGRAADDAPAEETTAAAFDLSIFAHAPSQLVAARRREPAKRDAERTLRDAGFSRSEAKRMVAMLDPQRDVADIVLTAGQQLLATLSS